MGMNHRQIEVFRAVMITGSISGAGRLLLVSQPAVSRVIHYLEDKLKLRLFERHNGRLHPTPEARKLFAEVDELYAHIQRINELANDLATNSDGKIKILSSPSMGEWLIPSAIAEFHRVAPGIRIEFETFGVDELVHRIALGQADIAIANLPSDHPNLLTTRIFNVRLSCVCRREDPLAMREAISPADLVGVPFISYGSDTPVGRIVFDFLTQMDTPAKIVCQVRNAPIACNLVKVGIGVTIADELVARGAESHNLVAVPLSPALHLPLSILSSKFEPMSKAAHKFAACVRQILATPL